MNKITIFLIIVLLAIASPVYSITKAEHQKKLFKKSMPILDETVSKMEKQDDLPESAFFSTDKKSNLENINKLIEEAFEMLQITFINDYRSEYIKYKGYIAEENKLIDEYKRARMTAPRATIASVGKFNRSVESLTKDIIQSQAKIKIYELHLKDLRRRFSKELEQVGLFIDEDKLDILLSTVMADDIVTMTIIYDNLKSLTTQLQDLVVASGEDLVAAKKYYGMFVVLCKVLVYSQTSFIDKIERNYLPKMKKYRAEAEINISNAQKGIANNYGNKDVLKSNIKANNLTIKAARFYILWLEDQRKKIKYALDKSKGDLFVATNTYRTVAVSSNVVDLLRQGTREFDALMNLQSPEMTKFENKELETEFKKLTERYKKEIK